MNSLIRSNFKAELQSAKQNMDSGNHHLVWTHLARAHILGQFYVIPHLQTHWWMLIFGLKTRNAQEILGQIPRLILATPGSFFKKAPKGNTGLSDVGIFQPMTIPEDLQKILNSQNF